MQTTFKNQTVLIVGASGGLGRAYVDAFLQAGATVLIAGRDADKLRAVRAETTVTDSFVVDLQQPNSLIQLADVIADQYPDLQVVVNATGYDVRKPFQAHTLNDVARSLDINLQGAIWLTYAFAQKMPRGVIVHMGGFADGYLALPYYSANVASRAGLRGFVDAMNRELKGRDLRVMYFCPSPADTPAEQPYHALWQQLGSPIVAPETVAHALLNAIQGRDNVVVMGGWTTRVFAKLNASFPTIANRLVLDSYGRKMTAFFVPEQSEQPHKTHQWRWLGIALMIGSFVGYGIGLLLVPLLPLTTGFKVVAVPSVLVVSEASFWIGGAIVGAEVMQRLRACLDVRGLFGWRKS